MMCHGAVVTELTYAEVGLTAPASEEWPATPPGLRRFERTVAIGHGDTVWAFATTEVLRWGVKRRSGFGVHPDTPVDEGADYRISLGWGPFMVHEPVRVVALASDAVRCGFAYGTLPGHPVCGEEAFIVHRRGGTVFLTLRSLTRAAPSGSWRWAFPALLVAQRVFRRRYLNSLTRGTTA